MIRQELLPLQSSAWVAGFREGWTRLPCCGRRCSAARIWSPRFRRTSGTPTSTTTPSRVCLVGRLADEMAGFR